MRPLLSMLHVNWGGVAAGTVAAYLAGFVWYGLLFEERWLALSGEIESIEAAASR